MCCYQAGMLWFTREYTETKGFFGKSSRLLTFTDYPAVLPYSIEHAAIRVNQDFQSASVPLQLDELINTKSTPIKTGNVTFEKPIAVIYNPNSGTKTNIRARI